jgi:CDP-paratose 2-epimerase
MPKTALAARNPLSLREKLGVCQWFHFEDEARLEQTVELMQELGVKLLRTGISWADFHRPGGKDWYDRQMKALKRFDVLLSIWHTPMSIAEGPSCAAPPGRRRDFADFVGQVIEEYGEYFSALELWNEPNNQLKWDFRNYDPQWRKFGEMIRDAAGWAKRRGRYTVLGGMIPVDHHWLALMREYGVLEHIDAVGIHAFPGMWWPGKSNWDWHSKWNGWADKIGYIRRYAERPIWVTETGLATWDLAENRIAKHDLQVKMLEDAARTSAERMYWYCLIDLDPSREAIEGFHVDENEYHLGLVTSDLKPKPAFERMRELMRQ